MIRNPFIRALLRPTGKSQRWFRMSVLVGGVLLALAPVVWSYSHKVHDLRGDRFGTAAHMRRDIEQIFTHCGGLLVVGGLMGLWGLRNVRGSWAQRRARWGAGAVAICVFAVPFLCQGLLAAVFAPVIYDTTVRAGLNDPIPLDDYLGLSLTFFLASFFIVIAWVVWAHRRYGKPAGHPVCQNCGYDLRGNTSGVCPECGEPR